MKLIAHHAQHRGLQSVLCSILNGRWCL